MNQVNDQVGKEVSPDNQNRLFDRMGVRLSAIFCGVTIVVIVAVQALQIAGVPFTDYEGRSEIRRQEAFQTLSMLADIKEERLVRMFKDCKADAQAVASRNYLNSLIEEVIKLAHTDNVIESKDLKEWSGFQKSPVYKDIAGELINTKEIYPRFDRIQIADVNSGRFVFSTNPSDLGRNVSDKPFFQRPLLIHGPYINDIERATYGNMPVCHISCPLKDKTGKTFAILVFVLNVDQEVRPVLHTGDGLGLTGEALLINHNVNILTKLKHPLANGTQAKVFDFKIQARPAVLAAGGQEGIIETDDYRQVPVLAAYRHIRISPDWGWGMVVKRDVSDILAPIKEDVVYTSWFALVAAVIIILLVTSIVRRMTSPLMALTHTADRLSDGDYSVRTELSGNDEIGRLGVAFDTMADTIQQTWAAMDDRTRELEHTTGALQEQQKVQEGTLTIVNTLSSVATLSELVQDGLRHMMEATGSQIGVVYLDDLDGSKMLKRITQRGISDNTLLPVEIEPGQGVIGLAAIEKKIEVIKDIPEETEFLISSVAGKSKPKTLISIPLVLQGQCIGVIALASMHDIPEAGIDIVHACQVQFATAVSNAHANVKKSKLAEQLTSINQDLASKNEELQAQSEELHAQTEQLQAQTEELHATAAELEAQRVQLEEASRLKSEFLSNMSHELRTPLNSVLALAQLMITRGPGKKVDTDIEHLGIIERNGRHLLNLINDILDIAKIESGRMDLILSKFVPEGIIQEAIATVTPLVKEKGLTINLENDDLPEMYNDKDKLKQILLNLLSNAVKFTDDGYVGLTVCTSGENITFQVSDSGIGIGAQHLEHIFEEFRQVDGSSTRRYEGTGLGLAISQRLAHHLGGEITVVSEPDKGSTFTLTVPIKKSGGTPSRVSAESPLPLAPVSHNKLKVLVVDDEPEPRALICKTLEQLGYEPVEAMNGVEALHLAKTINPFAITLDILMPGMDGWEVLQKIKSDTETSTIPVVIVSVSCDKDTGQALGASGYLVKPVNDNALKLELDRIKQNRPIQSILVADDDLAVREQLKYILGNDNYSVCTATNGEEALDAVNRLSPDAVILDLMMPKMDGFEVLEHLKENEINRDLPTIVLTSKDLTREEKESLAESTNRVIAKDGAREIQLRDQLHDALLTLEGRKVTHHNLDKTHILIMDDNEIATLQLRTILEEEGYEVTTASNGKEGMNLIAGNPPDAIILDLMMPEMDGFQVLEQVRSAPGTSAIPVLILTAKELTEEDRAKLTYDNILHLIQKGNIDRNMLLENVMQLVNPPSLLPAGRKLLTKQEIISDIQQPVQNGEVSSSDNPILVVEDNPDNLLTISAILDSMNLMYITADSGREGIEKAKQVKPSLILMDIQLPDFSGIDALKEVKENPELKNIPVVALTARAMKGDREEFLSHGFDDYISKPINIEELEQLVRRLTDYEA